MTVIGVSDSHNSAVAALCQDGTIAAVQEERLRRVKNFHDIPTMGLEWLTRATGVQPKDVDVLALAGMPTVPLDRPGWIDVFRRSARWQGRLRTALGQTPLRAAVERKREQERRDAYVALGFRPEAIKVYGHHACHAATAYYGQTDRTAPMLVLTVDGGGDGLCASVSIGENNKLKLLHEVPYPDSFGTLYAVVTYMLGMVPLEHEYKIMGMAPYASMAGSRKIADRLHTLFQWVDDRTPVWRRAPGVPHTLHIQPVLEKLFYEQRFDNIMGGVQLFTEEILCEFVRRAIAETGIRRLCLSGGVFMNVKANKRIMEMEQVDSLFVFPSCGDETNAIGAAYLARAERKGGDTVPPLSSMYLGPEWSDDEIVADLSEWTERGDITLARQDNINEAVADLLVAGHVVGRFAGREEFGARSLGNRAILADPRNPDVIREINEMVKSRDFWMPFAASLAAEYADVYLKNPKHVTAPYMILSFDTTAAGGEQLKAGTHPYDRTCRPQVVTQDSNAAYWDLIQRFASRSGVGGVLNTSLNLHGLPLVHRPRDAVHVLLNSGLNWLAVGPFLISKKA